MSVHVVGAYARAGAAAVVIEDKIFPKDTSLLAGGGRSWCGSRSSRARSRRRGRRAPPRPVVIARTEALIADLGLDEALQRGAAYAEAGADLLLVHSKRKTPDEIVAFAERWQGTIPLTHRADRLPRPDRGEGAGARQDHDRDLRQPCDPRRGRRDARRLRAIRRDGGIHDVDKQIASVEDIFDLQRVGDEGGGEEVSALAAT